MAPSDPLHGIPDTISEETRAVVNCIMVKMMHLMAKLLAVPDHATTRQETLDALLHQETVSAIAECGLQPPSDLRDSLHPADHQHQDGESTC